MLHSVGSVKRPIYVRANARGTCFACKFEQQVLQILYRVFSKAVIFGINSSKIRMYLLLPHQFVHVIYTLKNIVVTKHTKLLQNRLSQFNPYMTG